MKESDLYPPVREWLRKHYPSHVVYVEMFNADVVAVRDEHVVVVELKACLSSELMQQLKTRSQWADEVWACVGSEPKFVGGIQSAGFGLLKVVKGKVRKVRTAKPQPYQRHKMRAYRLKRFSREKPAMDHELAGLPSCAALREQRQKRQQSDVV